MFVRQYAFRSYARNLPDVVDQYLNDTVRAFHCPHAQAAVVNMTTDDERVHFLIEYWREEAPTDGDQEQTPARAMDPAAAVGKPRRRTTRANDHARAAARDQSKGIGVSVESNGEVDVALPFAAEPQDHPPIYWP